MSAGASSRLRNVTSRQNGLVKQLRAAFRAPEPENGLCAIESVRIVQEALRSGVEVRAIFLAESAVPRLERLAAEIPAGCEALVLPDDVFASAVATESPQGVAALVRLPAATLEDACAGSCPLLVASAGLQDPGNLGTAIRSLEAFGGSGMLLGEGSVSFANAKAIRASAGSVFRLPLARVQLAAAIEELRARDIRVVGAAAHEGRRADRLDLTRPVAIFIGNEGAGLSPELVRAMDELVTIPQLAAVESLNAGVAASVLLYEAFRQRGGA